MTPSCTEATHENMKSDATQWSLCLPLVDRNGKPKASTMEVPGATDDEPGYVLHLRNCPACGSTLFRRVD